MTERGKAKIYQHERQLLIGGTWRPATGSAEFETLDPATGKRLAVCADAGAEDVDDAVAAAASAFESAAWRDMLPARRARLLWRIAELIERDAGWLAALETRDQGQPLDVSASMNIPMAAEVFRYYAGWCTKIGGRTEPISVPETLHYTRREPVGVCALITPWNFPPLRAAPENTGPVLARSLMVRGSPRL